MRYLAVTLAFVLASSWTSIGRTGEDGHGSRCPRCHETCYPTVTKGTETKQCWEVESKTICIPKVRFPWEAKCCNKGCGKDGCADPKPGRTKTVNVLVKHEYECSTCKYSWDPDGDKYGNGKSDKASAPISPAVPEPRVADPPPVEARQPSNRRVSPAAYEQSTPAAAVKRSYAEILTSLLN